MAIMPSKYTDEMKIHLILGEHFSMGRKAKYSAKKLIILNGLSHSSIREVTRKYLVDKTVISLWQLLYKYQGLKGLQPTPHNPNYSKKFKSSLAQKYQKSTDFLKYSQSSMD